MRLNARVKLKKRESEGENEFDHKSESSAECEFDSSGATDEKQTREASPRRPSSIQRRPSKRRVIVDSDEEDE